MSFLVHNYGANYYWITLVWRLNIIFICSAVYRLKKKPTRLTVILYQVRYLLLWGYIVFAQENNIFSYISQYLWYMCVYDINWSFIGTHTGRVWLTDILTICVNSLLPILHVKNDKYKWMQVDTIYNII